MKIILQVPTSAPMVSESKGGVDGLAERVKKLQGELTALESKAKAKAARLKARLSSMQKKMVEYKEHHGLIVERLGNEVTAKKASLATAQTRLRQLRLKKPKKAKASKAKKSKSKK